MWLPGDGLNHCIARRRLRVAILAVSLASCSALDMERADEPGLRGRAPASSPSGVSSVPAGHVAQCGDRGYAGVSRGGSSSSNPSQGGPSIRPNDRVGFMAVRGLGALGSIPEADLVRADGGVVPVKVAVWIPASESWVTLEVRSVDGAHIRLVVGDSARAQGFSERSGHSVTRFPTCNGADTEYVGAVLVKGPTCATFSATAASGERAVRDKVPIGLGACRS